jgi:hypothetical protein
MSSTAVARLKPAAVSIGGLLGGMLELPSGFQDLHVVPVWIPEDDHLRESVVVRTDRLESMRRQTFGYRVGIFGTQRDHRALRIPGRNSGPALRGVNREVDAAKLTRIVERNSVVHLILEREAKRISVETGEFARIGTDE